MPRRKRAKAPVKQPKEGDGNENVTVQEFLTTLGAMAEARLEEDYARAVEEGEAAVKAQVEIANKAIKKELESLKSHRK